MLLWLNPFRLVGLFLVLRWLFVRAPRGVLHLLNPASYDRWKIREDTRAAWRLHRRDCSDCSTEHRAHLLAEVEDALTASGVVHNRLPRVADRIERAPRRARFLRVSRRRSRA